MVEGIVRNRKHQFGRQSTFGTPVAAQAAYPFKGVPDVNLNWTDDDIDVGSLDPVATPYPAAPDLTAPLTCPSLRYNMLPLLLCAIFGGDVDGVPEVGGTSVEWTHEPASLTVDDVDVFTYENGDDDLDDWFQLGDGILETLEVQGPEGLGPLQVSSSAWRFGSVGNTGSTDYPVSGTVPTPSLELDPDEPRVFLKDLGIYIASSVAGLGAGQILDKLHSFTWRVSGDVDQKRWANADQSFDIDEYSRASRMIELVLTFAKGTDITGTGSESDAWMSKTAVTRYIRFKATSEELASTSPDVPFSWQVTSPMRYYTRETTDSGGNSVVVLTARAFFDGEAGDLGAVCESVAVCTLVAADL